MNKPIVCVLTGGPCGGKTSSLDFLKIFLSNAGYNCLTIPEVYTVLMNNGCGVVYPNNYTDSTNRDRSIECLGRELLFQLSIEDSIISYSALSDKPVVIICDRGALDLVAYAGEDIFQVMITKLGQTKEMLHKRYDIVLHLVTAASGAEQFYSNATNEVRKETVEEARALDDATKSAWVGHQKHHIINNNVGSFEEKLEVIKAIISNQLQLNSETSEIDNLR